MAKGIRKGTALNNVSETWNQNEKNLEGRKIPDNEAGSSSDAAAGTDLEQVIKEEAAAYDNENKENTVLPGERASVNDEDMRSAASDE